MKSLLNKIKKEKKKKFQSELKKLNKIQVVNKNMHEIKNEILRDYVGEFEMVGRLKIADQARETH